MFLTITFEQRLLRNVSKDDSFPSTTPVNYYSSLAWHLFLTRLFTISQLCALKLRLTAGVWATTINAKEGTKMRSLFIAHNLSLTPYYNVKSVIIRLLSLHPLSKCRQLQDVLSEIRWFEIVGGHPFLVTHLKWDNHEVVASRYALYRLLLSSRYTWRAKNKKRFLSLTFFSRNKYLSLSEISMQ
jgi:hypothetical protein